MEEPQRSKILGHYEVIAKPGGQWDLTIDRFKANLEAGADFIDVMAVEGALLLGSEGQTMDNLAFLVSALMAREAQWTKRQAGARKKAPVPAKRPRKPVVDATAADVWPDATVFIEGGVAGDADRSDQADI